MRLFIAEKPSMGREISKYLPEQQHIERRDGYIIHGDDVVTWAFGHVLEQAEPGEYDGRYKKWNAHDLPIVPDAWKLLISKNSEKQFHLIRKLIEKADTIVNAGDPDREGQLLIDEILDYVGNTKPVQRILLNALDEKSIRAALGDLRDNRDFFNLKQSALARSRADWLIGMNLSRAYTIAEQRKGHRITLPIGRVKTPTLALVVRRERELQSFTPIDYYTLKVLYAHEKGTFWATWQPKDEQKGLDSEGRLLVREVAETLAEEIKKTGTGIVTKATTTKKKEPQLLPLSLSALQVAAGKLFSYDPQTVLDTAQQLYEKKLTTYPRSDCDYIPTNQLSDKTAILSNLQNCGDRRLSTWASHADQSIQSRAWNDKKITAHHAIIPTTVACPTQSLSERERNIYHLIAKAYIAQFYPEHEYKQTKLIVTQCEENFVAHGRVVTILGWKELYQRSSRSTQDDGSEVNDDGDEKTTTNLLPPVKKGDSLTSNECKIDKKATKPPTRFTAATLLQAMKEIHKFVKNEDLKKQLKAVSGIGTEATRATIIDELIQRQFIKSVGKKKVLQPTENGYVLVDALPDELLYPDETAVWEERLARMSDGGDTLESFLSDQVVFLTTLINKLGFSHDDTYYGGMRANIVRTIHRGQGEKNHDGSDSDVSTIKSYTPSDTHKLCPQCNAGHMVQKHGKFGIFWGCSNYPACTYTEKMNRNTQIDEAHKRLEVPEESKQYKCPRCHTGYFVKQVVRGKTTWICSNRNECRTQCADVNGKPSLFK